MRRLAYFDLLNDAGITVIPATRVPGKGEIFWDSKLSFRRGNRTIEFLRPVSLNLILDNFGTVKFCQTGWHI